MSEDTPQMLIAASCGNCRGRLCSLPKFLQIVTSTVRVISTTTTVTSVDHILPVHASPAPLSRKHRTVNGTHLKGLRLYQNVYFGPRVVLDELHLVFKPDTALVRKKRLAAYPLAKSVWDSGQPASFGHNEFPSRCLLRCFTDCKTRMIPFSRNVWLRVSSSNRDVLERSP